TIDDQVSDFKTDNIIDNQTVDLETDDIIDNQIDNLETDSITENQADDLHADNTIDNLESNISLDNQVIDLYLDNTIDDGNKNLKLNSTMDKDTDDLTSNSTLDIDIENLTSDNTIDNATEDLASDNTIDDNTDDLASDNPLDDDTKDLVSDSTIDDNTDDLVSDSTIDDNTEDLVSDSTIDDNTDDLVSDSTIDNNTEDLEFYSVPDNAINDSEPDEPNKPNDLNDKAKINMQCFDSRNEDVLIEPLACPNITSKTLDICSNFPITPTGIIDGVIAKIPVVLAQLVVPFHISSTINLPKKAFEIKDIKKRLKLTQCLLLQPTNILFIKGFLRKDIDYSTRVYSNNEILYGDIQHCTVDVPFECSTAVNFFKQPLELIKNTKREFQYLKEEPHQASPDKKSASTSGDWSEFNQLSEEFFNELPFCKLLSSNITEFNEYIDRKLLSSTGISSKEEFFIQIEEKMVIELKLEILQNQPVVIPPVANSKSQDLIK
ncbi:MAG: CsxC family protein, partial [Tissierellaceae bacterium]